MPAAAQGERGLQVNADRTFDLTGIRPEDSLRKRDSKERPTVSIYMLVIQVVCIRAR
jgi:hypothetical protein